jgi:hypothetical protein
LQMTNVKVQEAALSALAGVAGVSEKGFTNY